MQNDMCNSLKQNPMVSPFFPLIAGHFLVSMHILRGKKGEEGEKLSPFCWPKNPWRKKPS
jgi:hypothetical protein